MRRCSAASPSANTSRLLRKPTSRLFHPGHCRRSWPWPRPGRKPQARAGRLRAMRTVPAGRTLPVTVNRMTTVMRIWTRRYRAPSVRRTWPRWAGRCRTRPAERRPAPGRASPLVRAIAVNPRARTSPGTAPTLLSAGSTPCSGFRRRHHRPGGPPRPALVPPCPPSGSSPPSGRARRPGPPPRRRNGPTRPRSGTSHRGRAQRSPRVQLARVQLARVQLGQVQLGQVQLARVQLATGPPGARSRAARGARTRPTAARVTATSAWVPGVRGRRPGPVRTRAPRPARPFPQTRCAAAASVGPAGRGCWPGWPRWRSWA